MKMSLFRKWQTLHSHDWIAQEIGLNHDITWRIDVLMYMQV